MIQLKQAENALKQVYLEVISNQLNCNIDPFISKVEKTTRDVWGKEILIPYQRATEFGEREWGNISTDLANVAFTIELFDKAIRVAQNNAGAFVNLLNSEIESMLKEGMYRISNAIYTKDTKPEYLPLKAPFRPIEFISLFDIFNIKEKTIYGLDREEWGLVPEIRHLEEFNPAIVEEIIDDVNPDIDFLICNSNMKRKIHQYFLDHRQNVGRKDFGHIGSYMEFNSNVSIIPYKNIPDNEIWLVNSRDFTLNQLCDWQWLPDEEGRILRQDVTGKPVYRATLVKYANLMCHNVKGQIKIIVGDEK